MSPTREVSVKIEPEQRDRLNARLAETGETATDLIARLLAKHLGYPPPESNGARTWNASTGTSPMLVFRLPEELHRAARLAAVNLDTSVSAMVRDLLERELSRKATRKRAA